MRLARRTPEEGKGRRQRREGGRAPYLLSCLSLPRAREAEDGYISGRRKNGGRECFWLFLFTKEQRRERERESERGREGERERMDGRKEGRMDE